MNASFYIFLAALLNVLSKSPAVLAMAKQPGGYDNRHPRQQQKKLSDWGERAVAAHYNTIENFPIFAAGMLVALFSGTDSIWLHILGLVYLTARILYIYLYVADLDRLRSLVWGIGFLASLTLFFI